MEGEAQLLEVHERAATEVEDRVLADPADDHEKRVERHRAEHGDHDERDDDAHEWDDAPTATLLQRRNAVVDADRHEKRTGELRERVDGDEHGRDQQRPQVRPHQRPEEPAAPASQQAREPGARFVHVLRRDPSPGVHRIVAGEVEGRVLVDLGNRVGFDHHATRSSERSSSGSATCSAAWLRMAA